LISFVEFSTDFDDYHVGKLFGFFISRLKTSSKPKSVFLDVLRGLAVDYQSRFEMFVSICVVDV